MVAPSYVPLVAVTRGGIDESVHHGAIALAGSDGALLAQIGSASVVTYLRSSAKPIQTIPLLVSGADAHFGLTEEEIAIIIGSHGGEPRHVRVVRSILGKLGLTEDALLCGTHAPYHKPSAKALEREGALAGPIHNNCSGKHAGMLALALHLGLGPADYVTPSHPVQRLILQALAAFAGVAPEALVVGIDGCSAPTFALPLGASAAAFARLMEPVASDGASRLSVPQGTGAGGAAGGASPAALADAARRAVAAMRNHPFMIAGEGRIDTDLMLATGHDLVAKAGAEGFYAIGFRRAGRGYGLAIKIADGSNERARNAVVLRALDDLGLLDPSALDSLRGIHLPPILNRPGTVVGAVEARFNLIPTGSWK